MKPLMRKVQNAQIKALMESPYYQAFLDLVEDMKQKCKEKGCVGSNDFETVCLAVRRDERLLTLDELVNNIEEYASNSRV